MTQEKPLFKIFAGTTAMSPYLFAGNATNDCSFKNLKHNLFKQRQRIILTRNKEHRLNISSQKSNRSNSQNDKQYNVYSLMENCRPGSNALNYGPFKYLKKGKKLRALTRQGQISKNTNGRADAIIVRKCPTRNHDRSFDNPQKNDVKLLSNIYNIPIPSITKHINPRTFSTTVKFRQVLKPVVKGIRNNQINKSIANEKSLPSKSKDQKNQITDSLTSFGKNIDNIEKYDEEPKNEMEKKTKPYRLVMNDIKPMFFFNMENRLEGNTQGKDGSELNTPSFMESFRLKGDSKQDCKTYAIELKENSLMNETTVISNMTNEYYTSKKDNYDDIY